MVGAVYLVLEALFNAGYNAWGLLGQWLSLWVLPKHQQSFDIVKLFDAQKVAKYRKDKGFKRNASEMLTLHKPLQYFLEVMYMSNSCMVKECRSFSAWCQLLDYLQSIPSLDSPCPKTLLGLVESALECHTLAGFADYTKPKHHWTLHFFDLKRWGQLPSCWSCERKHKTARKYGSVHCNLKTYDQGLLVACTMEHLHNLQDAELFDDTCHLLCPRDDPKSLHQKLKAEGLQFQSVQSATSCKLSSGSTCTCGDVVFFTDAASNGLRCGKALHFLLVLDVPCVLLNEFKFAEQKTKTATVWETCDQKQLLPLQDVLQPVVHSFGKNGRVTCLKPAPLLHK